MPNNQNMKHAHDRQSLPEYIRGLAAGKFRLKDVAQSTGYSRQWISTLKKNYLLKGDAAFVHGNKGRTPVNKMPYALKKQILSIYQTSYKDVNFSYYVECLREFSNIRTSYRMVYNILHEAGIRSPEQRKVKRKNKIHRPRIRREHEGDMIQLDGTPYAWFYKFGNLERFCISGSVDDATSKITGLYMTENECLYGYMEVLRQTCTKFGVPREAYTDRAAIFCHTPKNTAKLAAWERLEIVKEKHTQWQRILEEMHVNQILAWSPEAKGRVERMWHTLQGQLPQWLYLHGADTVEKANALLPEYIEWYNSHFAVEAHAPSDYWRESPEKLNDILCARFSRRVDRQGCVTFQGTQFYTPSKTFICVDAEVCISERGMYLFYKGLYYPLVPVGNKVQQTVGDSMPQVVENIIHRYLYAFAKEISA